MTTTGHLPFAEWLDEMSEYRRTQAMLGLMDWLTERVNAMNQETLEALESGDQMDYVMAMQEEIDRYFTDFYDDSYDDNDFSDDYGYEYDPDSDDDEYWSQAFDVYEANALDMLMAFDQANGVGPYAPEPLRGPLRLAEHVVELDFSVPVTIRLYGADDNDALANKVEHFVIELEEFVFDKLVNIGMNSAEVLNVGLTESEITRRYERIVPLD